MVERVSAYRKTVPEVDYLFDTLGQPDINPYTGDKIWVSFFEEKSPFDEASDKFILALSPLGEKTLGSEVRELVKTIESGKFEPRVRDLNKLTGLRGVVKRTRLGRFLQGIPVYIKTLAPIAEPFLDVTGIEQFTAMRLLEVNGVDVASPLMATNYRIVTREVRGRHFPNEISEYKNYLETLNRLRERLITQGAWNAEWRIDEQPYNYLRTRNGFVAIDPIFRRSLLFLG